MVERIFHANGVRTEYLRPVDYEIPADPGMDYAEGAVCGPRTRWPGRVPVGSPPS